MRLSDKVVGYTKLGKTQRDFGLLFAVLSDELQLGNIFLLIKLPYYVPKSYYIVLYLLKCVTETIQVTIERKYFPREPHVCQPCCR